MATATRDEVRDIQVGGPAGGVLLPRFSSPPSTLSHYLCALSSTHVYLGVLLVQVVKYEYWWHPSGQRRASLNATGDPLVR